MYNYVILSEIQQFNDDHGWLPPSVTSTCERNKCVYERLIVYDFINELVCFQLMVPVSYLYETLSNEESGSQGASEDSH